MGWEGIGTLIGKLSDYIPGAKERRRNKEDKLRKEYEALLKSDPTDSNSRRLERIAKQLSDIQKRNKNG